MDLFVKTVVLEGEMGTLCEGRSQFLSATPPGPQPALESHHGERSPVRQRKLYVHRGKPVRLHQSHVPP